MHAKSILAALAVPVLVYGAAIPQEQELPEFNWDESPSDIVGGVAASRGDLSSIVSVQLAGLGHLCGGTLLNANTVVSAAHCYFGITTRSFSIRAGSLVSTIFASHKMNLHLYSLSSEQWLWRNCLYCFFDSPSPQLQRFHFRQRYRNYKALNSCRNELYYWIRNPRRLRL